MNLAQSEQSAHQHSRTTNLYLIATAVVIVLLHLLTNSRYGFHRDELQFLSDARHLDWGYTVYPPITPLLGRLGLSLFGLSLVWLRLFPVLAQAASIVVTGLMARELGGRRLAQFTAAAVVALSPMSIHYGTEFMYSSFDYLWWILAAYFLIRLFKSGDARWWIAVGLAFGIGLETKYTILFFICGLLGGMILTQARSYFGSRWFWLGVTCTAILVLPNAIWQVQHQFISLHCLHSIHVRDLELGRDKGFLRDQFLVSANLFAAPIWIAGLVTFFRNPEYRRYRPLAWAYLIALVLFVIAKGRVYYLAPAYPMLIAMGSGTCERWLATISRTRRRIVSAVFFTGLGAYGILCLATLMPWATGGYLRDKVLAQNWDLREEVGWDDMVKIVAQIRDNLPAQERQNYGILAGNYGEAGAIENLGPAYYLPAPISGANSFWLRGYPQPTPTTLIVLGYPKPAADGFFTNCTVVGQIHNSLGIQNEEVLRRPDILVCGPPRAPWPIFWKYFKSFQ